MACSEAVLAGSVEAALPAAKPNVVIILADDLGYGDLGCYGHPRFKTPNLDRMAAEGVRLTQFNTPMPFCAPTRAALLTGRYPFRNGLTTNPPRTAAPRPTRSALPAERGDAGPGPHRRRLRHRHGRQVAPRPQAAGVLADPPRVRRVPRHPLQQRHAAGPAARRRRRGRVPGRAGDPDPALHRAGLRFIERNRDRPFFLYFAHAMPHKPLACSEAFYKKSGAGLYGDVLAELDWSVGQVLARLKELGLDERTLVIFTSDNGPWYGGSTGGLRGMKATTWEGGFRVPCIVRWPGPAARRARLRRAGGDDGPVRHGPGRRRRPAAPRPRDRRQGPAGRAWRARSIGGTR